MKKIQVAAVLCCLVATAITAAKSPSAGTVVSRTLLDTALGKKLSPPIPVTCLRKWL